MNETPWTNDFSELERLPPSAHMRIGMMMGFASALTDALESVDSSRLTDEEKALLSKMSAAIETVSDASHAWYSYTKNRAMARDREQT